MATTSGLASLDVDVLGTYTLTYTVSDSSGNKATPKTRTVSVVDTEDPIIVLVGDASATHELGSAYSDPGATVSDNHDNSVTVNVSGSVNGLVAGTYTLTYDSTDASGNQAIATRTVIVQDTLAPVISLQGNAIVSHLVGTAYSDAGVAAMDAAEGTVDVTTSGAVQADLLGNYLLRFTATDSSGNDAIVTRTVKVVDTVAPVIVINGDAEVTQQLGSSYNDPGALLTDNYDDDVALTASGSVDVNTAGTYTLTYTGEDSSKNQAAPVTRTIEVVDLVAPVIVLNGASSVSHQIGSAYTDAGSTVTDNIDADLSATVAGSVDVNTLGTYTLSFSATDSSGNKAATVTRTITVVDSAPPLITLLGDADMTIALGSTFTDPFATAEDAQDGSVDVVVIGEVDSSTAEHLHPDLHRL